MTTEAHPPHLAGDPLDQDRLRSWLVSVSLLAPGAELATELLSGGNQNLVARLDGGDRPMILRRPAAAVPPGRNRMMAREFQLLSALEGTDVPHAVPLAICTDESVLGATFYLMSEIDGWSPAASPDWPAPYQPGGSPGPRRQLATELVKGLAALAAVDWRAQGLETFGRPDGFHERQVDRWTAHWDTFRFRPLPGLAEAGEWLRENIPAQWRPGLMHGDYSFLNVMFRHGDAAQLAAIVDWEMATIGDPVLDLAWLARQWPTRDEPARTRYVDYTGMPRQEDLADLYRELTGNPLTDYRYYQVLANFKLAIVLEGGYARYLKGEAANPKVAHYDEAIQKAARVASALIAGDQATT